MNQLNLRAIRASLIGIVVMAALLFLPAGTLRYWQAWLFLAVFVTASTAITVYLAINDPQLLERRMSAGPRAEKEKRQKIIMWFAMIGFVALLVFPALDHRYGWSRVPAYVTLLGDVLVVVGFLLTYRVFKVNSYGASTIQIAEGQSVISTGPYALVRHPMYAGAIVTLLGIPLALGSWWGLLGVVVVTPVLIWRLLNEEDFLQKHLPGYIEYKKKVRHRLIPYVW